ncbi:Fic family protein [Candidatus Woesearchaeota archaeon]|nr:Fic family protein [Candidatus Woesearchaeota archaeon]
MIEYFKELNKKFDKGIAVNQSSLEFAISYSKKSEDWQEQLALILRAIINDHAFSDGNKRTAAAYAMAVFESRKLAYDTYKVEKMVLGIAKNRITETSRIRRMIRYALQ